MHQNSNNKRTYNTSGKSVVVVVKTESQEMNTFRVKIVDMPGECIIKIGPVTIKFHCDQTNYLENGRCTSMTKLQQSQSKSGRCTRMTKLQQSHSKSNISPPGAHIK